MTQITQKYAFFSYCQLVTPLRYSKLGEPNMICVICVICGPYLGCYLRYLRLVSTSLSILAFSPAFIGVYFCVRPPKLSAM